jgi:hypothetical protein
LILWAIDKRRGARKMAQCTQCCPQYAGKRILTQRRRGGDAEGAEKSAAGLAGTRGKMGDELKMVGGLGALEVGDAVAEEFFFGEFDRGDDLGGDEDGSLTGDVGDGEFD